MVGKQQKKPTEHITGRELKNKIKKKKDQIDILKKLEFIEELYNKTSVSDACNKFGISDPTGYKWLDKWNNKAYLGLFKESKYKFDEVLDDDDLNIINLELTEIDEVTLNHAKNIISDNYGRILEDSEIKRLLNELGYTEKMLLPKNYEKNSILKETDLRKIYLILSSLHEYLSLGGVEKILFNLTKKKFTNFEIKNILIELGYKYNNHTEKIKKMPYLDEYDIKKLDAILSKKDNYDIEIVRSIIRENFHISQSDFIIKTILEKLNYIDLDMSEKSVIIRGEYEYCLKFIDFMLSNMRTFNLQDAKTIISTFLEKDLTNTQLKMILKHLGYANEERVEKYEKLSHEYRIKNMRHLRNDYFINKWE